MTSWATFRTACEQAFAQALPPALRGVVAVSWAGGARPFGGVDGRLLLSVVSHVEEHERDATLDEFEISSVNLVTLQVTAESQHDDPSLNALRLIEQVRLGLRKDSVTEIFAEASINLVEIPMSPQLVPTYDGGRQVSAYAFDVTLRTVFSLEPDAVEDSQGLIEHVQADATLTSEPDPDTTYAVAVDDPTPEP